MMMQTKGPTARMMATRESGDITSTETARFDFLARIMDTRRFVSGFVELAANVSYEVIFQSDVNFEVRLLLEAI